MTSGPDAGDAGRAFEASDADRLLVVDAVDGGAQLGLSQIRAALAHPRSTTGDPTFPGRNSTAVFADERTVVKVRPEFEMLGSDEDPVADRVRWVRGRLGRERRIDAYPVDRTWFLLERGGAIAVGTAAVRRRPLHLWSEEEFAARWRWFAEEFSELYLRAAAAGWRLDEGLSNFAPVDGPTPRLRYLDDDLYPWDRGVGLRLAWTTFGRRFAGLGAEHGALLGAMFRRALERHPPLVDLRYVAEDLRADAGRIDLLAALADLLVATRREVHALLDADGPAPSPPRPDAAPAPAVAVPAPVVAVPATPTPEPPAAPAPPAAVQAPADPHPDQAPPPRPAAAATRVALLADIHANLDALEAVLAVDEVRDADELLVLGDSVGYGPDPAAVVDRLRGEPRSVVIRGNHDHAIGGAGGPAGFHRDALWSAQWTIARLDDAQRAWLAALPVERLVGDELALHGAPIDPQRFNAYVYAMTAEENLDRLELDGVPVCFYGNTHVAGAWVRRGRGRAGVFTPPDHALALRGLTAALVCPGSVGQPRDGVPGAAYAMFDRAEGVVRWGRVAYDVAPVQARMRSEGFPAKLIDRLDVGA